MIATTIPTDELLEVLRIRFRECRPRVLVVTDGPLGAGPNGFGLSQFISALQSAHVHGMHPEVIHRHRSVVATDTTFDDLSTSRFDVLFLFGITSTPISSDARDAVARFMQAGGGVFATGDHEVLGAGLSGDLPRVRAMRYWKASETPDVRDTTRLTTNLPGANRSYEFDDQADAHPQRLYPNFAVGSDVPMLAPPVPTSSRDPHPVLRLADGSALDLYPDHPHEGECRVPDDLTTTFGLDGQTFDEWPETGPFFIGGPRPRAVAYTMSAGNGFDGVGGPKAAVVPRSFISIAAYDGHVADVGRVVTDATWHHYVNVNLNGLAPSAMQDLERYWANLVSWLMPERARWCLFPWQIVWTLTRHPAVEEIRLPDVDDVDGLRDLGALVIDAIDQQAGSTGTAVLTDAVRLVAGRADHDHDRAAEVDPDTVRAIGEALVGALVVDVARTAEGGDLEPDPDLARRVVGDIGARVAGRIVDDRRAALERRRDAIERTARLLDRGLVGAS